MAFDDLLRAQKYSKKMLEIEQGKPFSDERIIFEALSISLVISYGRVFTTSNTINNEFKNEISQKFGNFRNKIIKKLKPDLKSQHYRLLTERDSSIAHSDAKSRNYKYYNNTPMPFGRNPFYPKDKLEIENILKIIEILIDEIGEEQAKVGKYTFEKDIFGS
jgi:hypothetical protein